MLRTSHLGKGDAKGTCGAGTCIIKSDYIVPFTLYAPCIPDTCIISEGAF